MGTCTGCLKYVLFIFNFAMWLLGCAVLAVGIWMKLDDSAAHTVETVTNVEDMFRVSYSAVGDEDVTGTIAWLFIVFGGILLLVTFIGCCGAVRENACLLGVYAICLFVLMLVLTGIGTWAYMRSEKIKSDQKLDQRVTDRTDKLLKKAMEDYNNKREAQDFMEEVEKRFKCCGFQGAKDYERLGYKKLSELPASSDHKKIPCLHYDTPCRDPYSRYVSKEIRDFLIDRYMVIVGVSYGVAVCMGLGFVFTVLLCCIYRRTTTLAVN